MQTASSTLSCQTLSFGLGSIFMLTNIELNATASNPVASISTESQSPFSIANLTILPSTGFSVNTNCTITGFLTSTCSFCFIYAVFEEGATSGNPNILYGSSSTLYYKYSNSYKLRFNEWTSYRYSYTINNMQDTK